MTSQREPGTLKAAICKDIEKLGGMGAVGELLGIGIKRVSERATQDSGREFTASQIDRIIKEAAKRELSSDIQQYFASHLDNDPQELSDIPQAVVDIVDGAAKINKSLIKIPDFASAPRSKRMDIMEDVVGVASLSSRLRYTLSKQSGVINA